MCKLTTAPDSIIIGELVADVIVTFSTVKSAFTPVFTVTVFVTSTEPI